ncbi:MAG TPA: DUF3570 domain-containing protein [Polyangiales bacterium]|nr:DUF3570 domain-containing protein [Polyangiales bacterium]
MQLSLRHGAAIWLAGALSALAAISGDARAEDGVDLGTTVFHETGGPLHMTVLVPSANASVDLGEAVSVRAGWTADIVSGASVAVVDAPAANIDAISSATVTDTRHAFSGHVDLHDGLSTLELGYTHAFENDYLSNAFDVTARTDLFDRDTTLSLSYARGFDEVCDVAGSFDPVMKPRMDSSNGCFSDAKLHAERDLAVHTWQAAWSQAWTPVLTMQLGASAQLLHGFQSNPYRAVLIGKTAAQEHHPNERARYGVGGGLRLWIVPLSGALSGSTRIYRDTWDMTSVMGEAAYEQSIFAGLRLRARGRYYTQGGVSFYSDDYVLVPRGQYFTGDRELSPMRSLLVGGQALWTVPPKDDGKILNFLAGLELTVKVDLLHTYFSDFHYDRAPVPNNSALIGSVELHAMF